MEISRNLKKSIQKLYETFGAQSRELKEYKSYIGLVEYEFITKDHRHLFLIDVYKHNVSLSHYNYPENPFDISQFTITISYDPKQFYKVFQTIHGYLIDPNFEETLLKYIRQYGKLL